MHRAHLELLIAAAKRFGDQVWAATEEFSKAYDGASKSECYDRFAELCDAMATALGNHGNTQLKELLTLEAFLRCGKHMPTEIKVANRARADKLIEEILRQ